MTSRYTASIKKQLPGRSRIGQLLPYCFELPPLVAVEPSKKEIAHVMSNSTEPPVGGNADKLNPRSKARQVLLMAVWNKVKARDVVELRDLAVLYRVSHGLPAQYLYGHAALNERWMLRFASYLKMAPQDIWPDWEYQELTHAPLPGLMLINDRWRALTPKVQSEIISLCGP